MTQAALSANGFSPVSSSASENGTAITSSERTWALAAHLSALSGYVGVPFGSILGPLVVWLVRRDDSSFVAGQAKEALNFHLSLLLYTIVAVPLVLVLVGIALLIVIPIFALVFTFVGAVKSGAGTPYRHPLTIRFVD